MLQKKSDKKNPLYENYERMLEEQKRKKKLSESYISSLQAAEAGDWETVKETGLSFPILQEKLIRSIYPELPDKYKYLIPVMWFLNGGAASDPVCESVKNALKFRPDNWIGKDSIKEDGIEIFTAFRGEPEDIRDKLLWSRNYLDAYVEAQRFGGKVFRGFITPDRIIAVDIYHCNSILQYRGVLGLEQRFPILPVNLS